MTYLFERGKGVCIEKQPNANITRGGFYLFFVAPFDKLRVSGDY
jgi:hypothetical protein